MVAKSFRNNMLSSQGCEVGFHLEVLSFQLAVYIGHLQKEVHPKVTSQRLARDKLVHFHGWKSLALPSVGPGDSKVF